MVTVRRMTKELHQDFLHYFDTDAFSDHPEWAYCYCLECHLDKETDERTTRPEDRRRLAKVMLDRGVMQGYLAYDGDRVVGWCSADDKTRYKKLRENPEFSTDDIRPGLIKAVYCYDIAPDFRGRGIARKMLDAVCRDAKAEGFTYVEAYPFARPEYPYQYHGTARMYARCGFEIFSRRQWITVVRKCL